VYENVIISRNDDRVLLSNSEEMAVLDAADWVIDADMAAVSDENGKPNVPRKYWKLPNVGETVVTEMPQEEKDVVDADEVAAYKLQKKRELADECHAYIINKCPAHNQITLFGMHSIAHRENKNNRADYIQAFWNWLDEVIAHNHVKQAEVDAAADTAAVDAVAQDFSTFDTDWGTGWFIAEARAIPD